MSNRVDFGALVHGGAFSGALYRRLWVLLAIHVAYADYFAIKACALSSPASCLTSSDIGLLQTLQVGLMLGHGFLTQILWLKRSIGKFHH